MVKEKYSNPYPQETNSSLNCSNIVRRFCDKNAKNVPPNSTRKGNNSEGILYKQSLSPEAGKYSCKNYVKLTYSGTWKLRKRKHLHFFGALYILYGKRYYSCNMYQYGSGC